MTCIIDGSHMRASDFDTAVITYAVTRYGFHLDAEQNNAWCVGQRDGRELVSTLSPGECQYLSEIADEAVEWCNDHDMSVMFYIDDSCLWGEHDDVDASEGQATYEDLWQR